MNPQEHPVSSVREANWRVSACFTDRLEVDRTRPGPQFDELKKPNMIACLIGSWITFGVSDDQNPKIEVPWVRGFMNQKATYLQFSAVAQVEVTGTSVSIPHEPQLIS